MRIAVISDTHNRFPPSLLAEIGQAEEIWHLGAVSVPETLLPLRAMQKPLYVIRGNSDTHAAWPWVIDFEREGFSIRLIHSPPKIAPRNVDLLFHGHTLLPRREKVGAAEFFNPGGLGKSLKASQPSWAWLTLTRGCPVGWEVIALA